MSNIPTFPMSDIEYYRNIFTPISISLVIIGLLGNSVAILVYSRKKMRKFSISTYFRAIAMAHIIINLDWLLETLKNDFQIRILDKYALTCKLDTFVCKMLPSIATWFEVLAALDRLFTALDPTRFYFIKKARFQLTAIVLVLVLNISFYAHLFIDTEFDARQQGYTRCRIVNEQERLDEWLEVVIACVIPLSLMFVSSVITLFRVVRCPQKIAGAGRLGRNRMRDLKFGITLVCVNLTLLLLTTPFRVILFFRKSMIKYIRDQLTRFIFISIIHTIYEAFYSISFYIQLLVNRVVRRGLFKLIFRFKVTIRRG